MHCNMKDLKDFLNESMKSATVDQFYNTIAELFDYFSSDEMWKKVCDHFKRNKSIFKAIDHYDTWRDLLDGEIGDIYGTRSGRNKIAADLEKLDVEVSKKLLDHIK